MPTIGGKDNRRRRRIQEMGLEGLANFSARPIKSQLNGNSKPPTSKWQGFYTEIDIGVGACPSI